ncbi:helix-turn-helix transcriptional regulator [Streptomyces sp. NBC_00237]|uniref:telomere-protecting terminal protein Tpg n=1 Tax=Streptomyces sp. NBC_00237 TaxID=2975687 RepID=UPI00225132A6|nr:helix-turn-helix transcriptional regulator [Streptomyces sp. NBC_00237]MCX5207560.1 helix-turn-helix transcriptional regulator [Streptomyces sp. NBC_00237]
MDEIHDALQRADQEAFTKAPPKTLKGQLNFLRKHLSAKEIGQGAGVTGDSVNRYRRGVRHPSPDVAAKIEAMVRERWQPGVRRSRRKQAASAGIKVETRASFGYRAAGGSTDEPRMRRVTVELPAHHARLLFDAQDSGANDQKLREIVADGIREVYFQDGGRRARDLNEVELKSIDYLDIEY